MMNPQSESASRPLTSLMPPRLLYQRRINMVDVRRVKLPGVGVLHTFVTDGGGKVGVITHRSGQNDLITFSDAEAGSDAVKVALRLDDDEAHTLAEPVSYTHL